MAKKKKVTKSATNQKKVASASKTAVSPVTAKAKPVAVAAVAAQPVAKVNWPKKFQEHRNTLVMVAIALIVAVGIGSYSFSALKQKALNSWEVMGSVLNTAQPNSIVAIDFKVKDLDVAARNFVTETLKDLSSMPQEITRMANNLEDLPLLYLPASIQAEALRRHNIARLERQLPEARNTTAGPWTQYVLGHLYASKGDALSLQKAGDYYNQISANYPDHLLLVHLDEVPFHTNQIKRELEWYQSKPQFNFALNLEGNSKTATLLTTKGKVTLQLFDKDCPNTVANFVSLVQAGFYNGLNCYKIEGDASADGKQKTTWSVWTGCPLGNGKGGPGHTAKGEIKEAWMHRGMVAMDNLDQTPGKIGSRFFIMTKYRELTTPYAVLGRVTDGIEVVDTLTGEDMLLDVTVK